MELNLEKPEQIFTAMPRGEYIQLMGDLMILALQTDLTRVSSIMVSPERWGTPLMVHGVFEKPIDHHSMSHDQGRDHTRKRLEKRDHFHVE